MKKLKVFLVFVGLFLLIFGIYKINNNNKINYIALGDSLAIGQNPYNEIGYGYSDYINNYLDKNNKLNLYSKNYAQSGYKTIDLLNDIKNNKKININNKNIGLKESLRESDLVTISIGANDFLGLLDVYGPSLFIKTQEELTKTVDKVFKDVDKLFEEISKYAKGDIIVIGYYNPIPRTTLVKEKIDELVNYSDKLYLNTCKKYQFKFISIRKEISSNIDLLPNPIDIHPSLKGYEIVANKVIDYLEEK